MNKGGRRRDPIWGEFLETEENGKAQAKCKACGHVQSVKACRMLAHIKSCKSKMDKISSNVNCDEVLVCIEELQPQSEKQNVSTVPEIQKEGSLPKKRKSQSLMNEFCYSTNDCEKKELDKLVGMFFYSCNVPFSHVENEHFKALISRLRPGYKLPSRKALAGAILDQVHEELQNETIKKLTGKTATLIVDGWSNIHNEPITVAALCVEGKSYFVEGIDTGSDHKTAEYLTDMSKRIVKDAFDKYNCQVKTVVTDNTNCMVKMRQELEKTDDTIVVSSGCSAHYLNLLGQDITPKSIMSHIIQVQQYFRNHHSPGAWLRDYPGAVKPQLPGETRWNSQLQCLDTFLRNHTAYTSIVNDHIDEIDSTITAIIRNFNLHKQVKDLVKQLKPISTALDRLQRDNANIADACHEWIGLLQNVDLKPHVRTVKDRFEKAILLHYMLAYLMHPKYKGEKLNSEQKEAARKWIEDKNSNLLPYVIYFETESRPFPKTYFAHTVCNTLNPVTWWRGVQKQNPHEIPYELYNYVNLLLSCPSCSAGLERIFSSFAFIHSKLRNRLLHATAKKLLFCYTVLMRKKI